MVVQIVKYGPSHWYARPAGRGWKKHFRDSKDAALGAVLWFYQYLFNDADGVTLEVRDRIDGTVEIYGPDGALEWRRG